MSALLGHNPIKCIKWKGTVISQVGSSIQRNISTQGDTDFENYRRAMPLKIYRREIAVNAPDCVHSRASASIEEINRPNGYIISSVDVEGAGYVLETPVPGSKNETGRCIDAASSANCAAINARKRVRSSGIIKKKLDPVTGDNTYFTNTKQYLTSRSRTYEQNSYHHVRFDDVLLSSTPSQTKSNIYIPNGISHCPKTQIVEGSNAISYYWIDASGATGSNTENTITFEPGYYDLASLNAVVQNTMLLNKHYILDKLTNSPVFLLNFAYNTKTKQIELQLLSTSNYQTTLMYLPPLSSSWTITANDNRVVTVNFPDTDIQSVFGFSANHYPPLDVNGDLDNSSATNIPYTNNIPHKVHNSYLQVYYKPSNDRFAQQGGVSSGSMTDRKKYEAITASAASYALPFGRQVANALAYGVQAVTYTQKDKIGFKNTQTPTICKWTGEVTCRQR
jgi:hypothetical protein